jgi:hypothetical protein
MEFVTILRELWRRRRLVGMAALTAVLVGVLLTYTFSLPPKSRKYEVGVASARILVDTPNSQVVEVAPRGSDALGARASLLANVMTEGEVKAEIASRAGLPPRTLIAATESDAEPGLPPAARPVDPTKLHLLTTRLVINPSGDPLPIIEIAAQAPDAAKAARLAGAAVAGLRAYLDSKAAGDEVSDARRLSVTGLGAPQATTEVRGPRRLLTLAAALFVFLAGCAAIVAFTAVQRHWRAASREDARGDDPGSYKTLLDQPLDGPSLDTPLVPLTPLRGRKRDEPTAKSA